MMDWDLGNSVIVIIAAVIAAAPGVISLWLWGRDRRKSYLHIEVSVDLKYEDFLTVMTVVENKGLGRKKLKNALLLIGPEDEDPLDTVRELTGISIDFTNGIVEFRIDNVKSGSDGRCLIPIDFYHSENLWIADEKMSYRVPISTQGMMRGKPYSVRFFIYTPGRPHRSTHDCFILPVGDGG